MSDQIARLQSAVREMLESLNALEYSHYNTRDNLEAYKPSTIETYGLTQEDMESADKPFKLDKIEWHTGVPPFPVPPLFTHEEKEALGRAADDFIEKQKKEDK